MAEQGGFADAGAGEQAEPLALAAGGEQVERAHAEIQPRAQPGALRRRGRLGAHRPPDRAGRQAAAAVQRTAERIDHPAEPGVGDGEAAAMAEHHGLAAGAQPVGRRERQCLCQAAAKPDDLRQDLAPAAGGEGDPVAHRGHPGEAGEFDREAADADQRAFHPRWNELAQGCPARFEFFYEICLLH